LPRASRLDFTAILGQYPAEENQKKAIDEARRLFPLVDGKVTADLQSALCTIREDYAIALKKRDEAIQELRARTAGFAKSLTGRIFYSLEK